MSNKGTETALKQEINLNIIPNNQQQLITGAKLNVVLLDMVDTLMYLLGNGSGGAANYENLYNKPSINGYELNGEISLSALGLISSADIALAYQKRITESNKLAADYISGLSKVAFTGDYNDLINKPEISGGEVSNVSWGEQTATSVTLIVEGVGKTLLTPQALDNYVQASTLFENGVIKSTLLPSYVDDVLEYTSRSNFPSTGQAGKIYVALDTNKTYRWGGSTYVVISETIAIGTTAGTAYDGAAGKALADAVAGIPNHYYNKTEIDDILLGYVDDAQIASYYNKTEVDNKLKGYVTNAAFTDSIDDYLTITDAADTYYKKTGGIISGGVTINGATTINNSLSVNSLKIGGISISVNSDGILFVEGTLATSGGLSVRGVSTGSGGGGSASLPAVWESLSGDRDEYKNVQINKSHLTAYLTASEVATSYATRGSLLALDERVSAIEGSSTSVSYSPSVTSGQLLGTIVIDGKGSAIYAPSIAGLASESWVSNNFLGLGGGTLTDLLFLKYANPRIVFQGADGTTKGTIGFYYGELSTYINNESFPIIHSGNIGSYNAGSASKLATPRTIWGQSFDGTGDITGAPSFPSYININRNANIGALLNSSKMGAEIEAYANDVRFKTYTASSGSNPSHLVLTSNGNVLIGTTTDAGYKLDVNGDFHTSGNIYIEQSGGIYCGPVGAGWRKIYGCDSDGGTYTRMASYAMLPDNDSNDCWQVRPWNGGYSSAYITVLHGGNVGIGTTSPSEKLSVAGNFTASGTIAGRSISVTSVNQSSDRRLKREESRPTPLTIEDVAQLYVRSYKWIDESMGKELQIGLYAQDVQTILPEIVRENEQSKSLGLDYGVGGAVFGVLAAQSIVKQIKPALTEQQKRIVELEKKVELLEKIAYGCK